MRGSLKQEKRFRVLKKISAIVGAVLATGLILYSFHVQSLAQHRVSFDTQADRAIDFLEQRAAQCKPSEKLAAVLDTDETSLSNYGELVNSNYVFDPKTFDA